MPIFQLSEENIFPLPEYAEKDGLLAVGGDLSEGRLLLAYSMGIFPWYSEDSPILWWSPDPRLVLIPEELKISRSLRQTINKNIFQVTIDRAFEDVIESCAKVHNKKDRSTWITEDMVKAYCRLHGLGYAHSVECWNEGRLVGGLYGIALGGMFAGESMFTLRSNASKVAFVNFVYQLMQWDFKLIDCQITTSLLKNFGAKEVSRTEFLKMLNNALSVPTRRGKWDKVIK